ncbi:MAG TPA: hypothetical protein PL091_09975 [Actinomycetota bacterium]|nr:hypothetical protein [Actinomycetota bacterium]
MSEAAPEDDFIPPWIHLESSLDVYGQEHEAWYRPPETPEEESRQEALSGLAKHALALLRTGEVPKPLEVLLEDYEPWRPLHQRIQDLIFYNYLLRRIEFDVAWEAVGRLQGSEKRVVISIVAMLDLRKATLSPTAGKYLTEVSELYMAGWRAPVFVMAGAVLEAAMRDRIPDEELRRRGKVPRYTNTGVYSIGQRMKVEAEMEVLSDEERARFWKVVNWRNDVVHVQPDIVPDPATVVLEVASLLARILPREDPA